jgi:acyl-CoA thioesterase
MDSAFDRQTAIRALGAGRFSAEIADGWRAGRGPHGGYLAAILLRALSETIADPTRTPRSLTIHYTRAPELGAVSIDTRIVRQGRSLSTLSASMEQDGEVVALALSAFSGPWRAPEAGGLPMPQVEPPDPDRRSTPRLFDGAPPFTRNLVLQPRVGAVPFTGAQAPMEVGGWTGLLDPRPIDVLSLALFADAWFPPSFIGLREPATAPTIDLTIHFRQPPATNSDPAELCLAMFRTQLVHEGFFEEDGVIWAADGTVLVQSRQMGLVIPVSGH